MAIQDGRFFTWQELKTLISAVQSLRAFDDLGIGIEDEAAVNIVIANTDQHVIANAYKNYPDKVASSVTPATAHPTLKTLALEYARACIAERMPGLHLVADPMEAMKMAKSNLRDLALGKIHLDNADQANARSATVSAITVGGSTDRTFDDFYGF